MVEYKMNKDGGDLMRMLDQDFEGRIGDMVRGYDIPPGQEGSVAYICVEHMRKKISKWKSPWKIAFALFIRKNIEEVDLNDPTSVDEYYQLVLAKSDSLRRIVERAEKQQQQQPRIKVQGYEQDRSDSSVTRYRITFHKFFSQDYEVRIRWSEMITLEEALHKEFPGTFSIKYMYKPWTAAKTQGQWDERVRKIQTFWDNAIGLFTAKGMVADLIYSKTIQEHVYRRGHVVEGHRVVGVGGGRIKLRKRKRRKSTKRKSIKRKSIKRRKSTKKRRKNTRRRRR